MRYAAERGAPPAKGEMTPMIDMTFQLIAFFMVVVNFSEADQNQRIKLPLSELAKPPEAAIETPITLQLTKEGTVIFGAKEVAVSQLPAELLREKQVLEATGTKSARQATIIIRADREAMTGQVQEVMEVCQKTGFEKFALRAKQEST
ncbi:MAG TPA: biopolymer transporter ExbD [Thermoguttaceae bacterium]|nr:biopolymer transporter ExbD [Thermoguttaceae bacterium]